MNARLKLSERQRQSGEVLRSKFEAAIMAITSVFLKTNSFQHAQTKGNERELPVRTFFKENLPEAYDAVGGEIVDTHGMTSAQTDVIIFNRQKNRAFESGNSHILAAEAALVTIEVKTQLNATEIESSMDAAMKLKSLKPLGKSLDGVRKNGQPANGQFRYFHCLFAYKTDLTEDNWAKKEYERLKKTCFDKNTAIEIIDRIYVVDRGMIIPNEGMSLTEVPLSGEALMHFFLHTMNFCIREDRRRPAVEYLNYAPSRKKAWEKLK